MNRLLNYRPRWLLRWLVWWSHWNATDVREHRKIAEWNCHVAEQRVAFAHQQLDDCRAELRKTEAAIRAYDAQGKDAAMKLALRGAR